MKALSSISAFGLLVAVSTSAAAQTYVGANAVLPAGLPTLTAARSTWQANAVAIGAGPLSSEGFEAVVAGNSLAFAGGTITIFNGTPFSLLTGNNLVTTQGNGVASFTTSGTTYVEFLFSSAINAFGVDITSIDQTQTSGMFLDNLGNSTNLNFAPVFASATFFGVTNSQSFNKVTLSFTGNEILNFDNLQWGAATVPEPSSALLMAVGVVGLYSFRRRRST